MKNNKYLVLIMIAVLTLAMCLTSCSQKEESDWQEVSTLEEAAEGAGLDMFSVIPDGLSLGDVLDSKFSYTEGKAQAYYSIAAVDLYVCKGLTSVAGEDISGDTTEYAYEWTQNIKGLEVKCFGNREGEATKTIWTFEDYSYAILAYGAGGDTDFGLSADDLSSLINSIQ